MKTVMVELQCSNCESVWQVQVDTHINSILEPEYMKFIKNESYFVRKCSKCGSLIHFNYPCIYHNTKKKFIVSIHMKSDFQTEYKVKKYSTDKESDFYEKIKILEDDLKPEIIEICKEALKDYLEKQKETVIGMSYAMSDDEYIWFNVYTKDCVDLKAMNKNFYKRKDG